MRKGNLGRDRDPAIWLAALDEEYRTTGRLIFVEGGKLPGIVRAGGSRFAISTTRS